MAVAVPLNSPGTYTIEDDGIRGNGMSVVRNASGIVIATIVHPNDFFTVTAHAPGVHLILNILDPFGLADVVVGNLADSAETPDSIVVRHLRTDSLVTLVSKGSITEGGADAPADVIATGVMMSAGTGVGTAANALETKAFIVEAETTTGGINIVNAGNVQIGGLAPEIGGLSVATSGNLNFSTTGFILLADSSGTESVRGGSVSGNVTLTALGTDADIFGNVNLVMVSAAGGGITLNAGRDIAAGTAGANFNNDLLATSFVTVRAGRDFLLDGASDVRTGAFGGSVGGAIDIQAGRNIELRNATGGGQTISAFAGDVILTTGRGGAFIENAVTPGAVQTSDDIVLNADFVLIGSGGLNTTGVGSVTIRPVTPGRAIDIGNAIDPTAALALSDAEIDLMFTLNLNIGDANSGPVEFSAPITPFIVDNMVVRSATEILVNSSITLPRSLTLHAGDDLFFTSAGSFTTTSGGFTGFVDQAQNDGGAGGVADLSAATFSATFITLIGNIDDDRLIGSSGNDTLRGGLGADVLNGGNGIDTADYAGELGAVRVHLGAGTGEFNTAEGDTLSGIENVNGTEFNDILIGGSGVNRLEGRGGNDGLHGALGADTLIGGSGIDTATYTGNAGAVRIDLFAGTGLWNAAQGDTLIGIENVTGTSNNDVLLGDNSANVLHGGLGADTLTGRGGVDTADYTGNVGAVRIDLFAGTGQFNAAQGDTLSQIENVTGTSNNDILLGDNSANVLHGGLGADTLTGRGGVDTADYTGNFGAVRVNLAAGTGQWNAAQGDVLSAIENVTGTSFNDVLIGDGFVNTLAGGLGNDTLTGAGGVDNFLFNTALGASNVDAITDYNVAADTIRIDDAVFTQLGPPGTLGVARFRIGAAAADGDDRIIYNSANGALSYDVDGNGGGAAVRFATLAAGLAMTNADFVVV